MPLIAYKPHQSDTSKFIDELKQKNPQLEAQQRAGRALLWNKPQNPELNAGFQAARVALPAYVYFGTKKAVPEN